jgi:hypothetical protein
MKINWPYMLLYVATVAFCTWLLWHSTASLWLTFPLTALIIILVAQGFPMIDRQ